MTEAGAPSEIRLQLDLGAARSFGSRSLFKSIAKDIRDGNLGAARIVNEIKCQYGDAYNGRKDRMTNWVQVTVEADSIANVPTIVPAVYISLCRDCDEEVIVAGKELCNTHLVS